MKNEYPTISVIINSHNGAKYLREAIESVYVQTYTNWEIILYNNFSTDETSAIIKQYDERLRYFRSDRFLCLGAARNEAIKHAKGEIIGFLDSDDIWLPEKLEKQLSLFQDASVGLVHSNAIYFVQGTKHSYLLYKKDCPPKGYVFGHLLRNNYLTLGTVLIRRKCLESIEWFPQDMNLCEEYDLFLRISYSWKTDYILEPAVKYRIHSQAWSMSRFNSKSEEMKKILNRLCLLSPDIKNKYKREILCFIKTTDAIEASILWHENKRKEARKKFLNLFKISKELKYLFFLFLTFICRFNNYNIIKHSLKYLKGKMT